MAENRNRQEPNREQQRPNREQPRQSSDRTPARAERRESTGMSRRDPFATMSASNTSPFGFMRRFTEEMDRLFEDFGFGRAWPQRSPSSASASSLWIPQVEVFERDNRLVVRADLPGLKREDINLEIRDDELVLSGERKDERKEEREGFYRSERSYGSFYRSIPLPEGVNADTAKASFQNGVLEITMEAPSLPAGRSRQVEIEERSAEGERRQSEKIG